MYFQKMEEIFKNFNHFKYKPETSLFVNYLQCPQRTRKLNVLLYENVKENN